MKKILIILSFCCFGHVSFSQEQEAQQLLLNWEKLIQFKKILQNMYDGWKVINKGYTTIKDLSSGNFKLHKNFLDALMEVSPAVKKYRRITDIINYQVLIVRRYKEAFNRFKEDKAFTVKEITYISKVYSSLFDESIKSLDELFMVITAGKMRMTDDERLQAIDRIHARIEDQFLFLETFNSSTSYLSLQRKAEQTEINLSKRIYGY
ncbi:MAG: TerB family tellurite resistance protein [Chitinophagaceae bacterium]|nr:TerB family tellurite resistance protein [Chitinophagaceae bacterium]